MRLGKCVIHCKLSDNRKAQNDDLGGLMQKKIVRWTMLLGAVCTISSASFAVSTLDVTANPTSIPANGTSTSLITVDAVSDGSATVVAVTLGVTGPGALNQYSLNI